MKKGYIPKEEEKKSYFSVTTFDSIVGSELWQKNLLLTLLTTLIG
jgi:hypothetical protein